MRPVATDFSESVLGFGSVEFRFFFPVEQFPGLR